MESEVFRHARRPTLAVSGRGKGGVISLLLAGEGYAVHMSGVYFI